MSKAAIKTWNALEINPRNFLVHHQRVKPEDLDKAKVYLAKKVDIVLW